MDAEYYFLAELLFFLFALFYRIQLKERRATFMSTWTCLTIIMCEPTGGNGVSVADAVFQEFISDFPAEHAGVVSFIIFDFLVNVWGRRLL